MGIVIGNTCNQFGQGVRIDQGQDGDTNITHNDDASPILQRRHSLGLQTGSHFSNFFGRIKKDIDLQEGREIVIEIEVEYRVQAKKGNEKNVAVRYDEPSQRIRYIISPFPVVVNVTHLCRQQA